MKKTTIICLFICILFCSCVTTTDNSIDTREQLEKGKNILLLTSDDGVYGTHIYTNSGLTVSKIILKNLKPFASLIELSNSNTVNAVDLNISADYDYIIVPYIIHWEDRATEWSGIPDRCEVVLDVYDNNKRLLQTGVVKGKSASMTLRTIDPSEIFEKALVDYISQMFI